MKIKSIVFLVGIFSLSILGSAFVSPEKIKEVKPVTLEEIKDRSFAYFLSKFEKQTLPFKIDIDDFDKYKNLKELQRHPSKKISKMGKSYNIAKYLPELQWSAFSRSGPPKIMPIARFYLNDKQIAIVYKTSLHFSRNNSFGYKMMVYDLKGNILPKPKKKHRMQSFGLAYKSIKETQTFLIDKKGAIWKNTYKNIWKKDVKKKGYKKNEIEEYELASTSVFHIKKNGTVVEAKNYPTNTRASLN